MVSNPIVMAFADLPDIAVVDSERWNIFVFDIVFTLLLSYLIIANVVPLLMLCLLVHCYLLLVPILAF